MPGSAALGLGEAGDYRHTLRDLFSQFVVTGTVPFSVLLTRTKLLRFDLMQSQETVARVAFVTLPAEHVFFSFPTLPYHPLLWRGVTVLPGEFMMHSRGEQLHQRIIGAGRWGMISLPAAAFRSFSKALTGATMAIPRYGQLLRPDTQAGAELLRLHASIGRIAQTKPHFLRNPETVRAMDNALAEVLVASVSGAATRRTPELALHAEEVLVGFEKLLAQPFQLRRPVPDLAAELGVSDRTLRNHCSALLGVSPFQYLQLRRLQSVRSALLQADPATARIGEIAIESGFTELGRLATRYRAQFGETPSTTLRRTQRLR